MSSILKVAGTGALKTHIMYKANLSHRQLEKYLAFLEGKGLIAKSTGSNGSRLYQATQNGILFYKEYSRISNRLEALSGWNNL